MDPLQTPQPDLRRLLKGGRRKWREGKDGDWRVEEKNEGPTTTKGERRKWIGGREGEGRDLPDQCQTASYVPVLRMSAGS